MSVDEDERVVAIEAVGESRVGSELDDDSGTSDRPPEGSTEIPPEDRGDDGASEPPSDDGNGDGQAS
jgi:hypothetical protein